MKIHILLKNDTYMKTTLKRREHNFTKGKYSNKKYRKSKGNGFIR